jgi:hypothetical protein
MDVTVGYGKNDYADPYSTLDKANRKQEALEWVLSSSKISSIIPLISLASYLAIKTNWPKTECAGQDWHCFVQSGNNNV